MERWEWIPLGFICAIFLAITVLVIDAAYHHWQEEHAEEYVHPKGWEPPRIQHQPGCATWDAIRHECEDD